MIEADLLSATRDSCAAVAAETAEHFRDELAGKPLDRALFAVFAKLAGQGAMVLEAGSVAGRPGVERIPQAYVLARKPA